MSENENILDKFKFNQETIEVDTTKKVKVGIIGTGWIAEAHAGVLKRCPDVEIVALADIVPGKAEAFAARKKLPEGIRFYNSPTLTQYAYVPITVSTLPVPFTLLTTA